ncbi:DNA polymerase I [Candidatus Dependentiae bacterium]|nr:DNA polymerase I [Candidatus Dependentiae bacterium]
MDKLSFQDAVFIIDGSSFLYRAYYSVRPLTTREGIPVNAVFGFCRMIRKLLDTYKPSHMVLVWDSKGKTVRHEVYSEYKATRQATPSDLMQQKEIIQEFADIIGLHQLSMPGVEADDLMFSVAKQLGFEKCRSVLVTSDKDLGQALGDYTVILDPFKEMIIDQKALEEKIGFSLEKLPFYYGLIGDSSDNIPGVAGIGPKGAQKLVQQFSSLQELYDNIHTIESERTKMLLEQSRENAFLSERLFKLEFYETVLTQESFRFLDANWVNAYPLFTKYEFKSLIKEQGVVKPESVTLHNKYTFILVDTPEELSSMCLDIEKYGSCALDTETDGLDPLQSTMVGMSLSMQEGISYYIPCGHRTDERQLSREMVIRYTKPILEDIRIKKYLHHVKFDALVLHNAGITLRGFVFDTMIAASLLADSSKSIGLKALSDFHFQEPMFAFKDIVKGNAYKDFSYVPLALATEYAAADAHQTLKLVPLFEDALKKKGLEDLFYTLEMPVLNVLIEMEKRGILLDREVLHEIDVEVSHSIVSLRAEIIDLIGPEHADINLNSPKQLENLLFSHLKLPSMKKTTRGASYSTDQEVLEVLATVHPVPRLIMRYRELFKLKTTYLDSLGGYVHKDTGRIHTTYNQTAVATGRLASSEPNLQNIPVKSFALRAAFKPAPGYLFLSADYSQIELRVLAYLSQDSVLLEAFSENRDIHALTAAGLFEVPESSVTHEQRQVGKRINFSILYGLTAHGLSQDLSISHALAKEYIERYMRQYPGVVAWMEQVIIRTKEKGYVETVWGRRRYLPGIYEKNKNLYDLARRVAINTVAQGTAAEIMKKGMILLEDGLHSAGHGSQILLQIHDELLIEVPSHALEETERIVVDTLQNVTAWNVPLVVSTRFGKNWQEVTK